LRCEDAGTTVSFQNLPHETQKTADHEDSGGWGTATLILGTGRIIASGDQKKHRLWTILGLLEGIVLTLFCLRFWLGGFLSFLQVSLPLAIAVIFTTAYIAALGK
jgi:hypothetical protein